jgi:DNA polymerase III subunit epsilon
VKKIAFLDFETNGFQGSEVLSMSLRFNNGTKVNRFYFPKEPYNEQSISIHGLTKEKITQLRANADYEKHFIDDKDIIAMFQDIDILVSHNIEFDYSFLSKEIKDMNFEIMDTMKANTKYFQKNPKLGEAAELYGIELIFDNLHGSAYDAEICEKIYNAMSEADKQSSRLYLTKVFAGRDENGDMVMPFGSQKGITAKKMTEDDARNFLKKYDSSLKHEMYELVLQRLHEFED